MSAFFVVRFLNGLLGPVYGLRYILYSAPLIKLSILPLIMAMFFLGYLLREAFLTLSHGEGWLDTLGRFFVETFFSMLSLFWSADWMIRGLSWLSDMGLPTTVAVAVALAVLLPVSFIFLHISCQPLFSHIAEFVLKEEGCLPPKPFVLRDWLRVSGRMAFISCVRMGLFLGIGGMVGIVSLFLPIPGIQLLPLALGFLLLAADAWDYSLEILEFPLRERLRLLRTHFWELLGFGACMGLVFYPFLVGYFLVPIPVVGGSLMVASLVKEQKTNKLRGRSEALFYDRLLYSPKNAPTYFESYGRLTGVVR